MRLIDADDLLITDEECSKRSCVGCPMYVNSCEEFKDVIINAPTIEPQKREKGKWIGTGDANGIGIFICDNCGKFSMLKSDFCPNCGADNREG